MLLSVLDQQQHIALLFLFSFMKNKLLSYGMRSPRLLPLPTDSQRSLLHRDLDVSYQFLIDFRIDGVHEKNLVDVPCDFKIIRFNILEKPLVTFLHVLQAATVIQASIRSARHLFLLYCSAILPPAYSLPHAACQIVQKEYLLSP